MSFKQQGTVYHLGDTDKVKETFKKREIVLETAGDYPQLVKFEFVQDRCELLDGLKKGDTVTVHFDLRGREWNGKYFTNLHGWKLDIDEQPEKSAAAETASEEGLDNLPF